MLAAIRWNDLTLYASFGLYFEPLPDYFEEPALTHDVLDEVDVLEQMEYTVKYMGHDQWGIETDRFHWEALNWVMNIMVSKYNAGELESEILTPGLRDLTPPEGYDPELHWLRQPIGWEFDPLGAQEEEEPE